MKKRRGGLLLIILGLVVALIVAAQVYSLSRRALPQEIETTDVLVVLQDIPERTVLGAGSLGLKRTLPETIPPGALRAPEQAVGLMTITPLYAGEIVLASRLADTQGRSGVAYSIEPGRVVITIPASDIGTIGALRPNDRIDLLVTILEDPPKDEEEDATIAELLPTTTQTTLQNLRILGIGSFGGAPVEGERTQVGGGLLTFAVEHQDALFIKALKDEKRVRMEMVLRAAGDEDIVQTEPVTLESIIERYNLSAQ